MDNMNMQENSRMIIVLRERGWTDKEINDLVLYMETGKEEYFKAVTEENENH